jgi:hypothetical protein
MDRQCARPGCAAPATATFGFDYGQQVVWLVELSSEAHPATYDLCRRHAATLSVPHGWDLRDVRDRPGRSTGAPMAAEAS